VLQPTAAAAVCPLPKWQSVLLIIGIFFSTHALAATQALPELATERSKQRAAHMLVATAGQLLRIVHKC
jgi:hypothetical protein